MKREDLSSYTIDEDVHLYMEDNLRVYEAEIVDQILDKGYRLFNSLQLAKLQVDTNKIKEAMENIEDYLESMRG